MSQVHLIITGRVQGVGYRAWFERKAMAARLSGWVRNRADGSVEAVIAGDAGSVQGMVDACYEGPLAAEVADVAVADWSETVPSRFEVRPTL